MLSPESGCSGETPRAGWDEQVRDPEAGSWSDPSSSWSFDLPASSFVSWALKTCFPGLESREICAARAFRAVGTSPTQVAMHLFPDPDVGQDCGQDEKGATVDEVVGWHHGLNGHELEQTPGDGEGLACCSPWGRRVGHD